MHIENLARGGNDIPVCWHRACHHNLHGVWDTSIPHAICGVGGTPSHAEEKLAARDWAARLRADSLASPSSSVARLLSGECARVENEKGEGEDGGPAGCAVGWAREANAFVCSHAMRDGAEWFNGRDLSEEYYERTAPVVEYLVGKAGVRLAAWLEAMVVAARRGEKEEWVVVPEAGQERLRNEDL
jgi:hypothetical protein